MFIFCSLKHKIWTLYLIICVFFFIYFNVFSLKLLWPTVGYDYVKIFAWDIQYVWLWACVYIIHSMKHAVPSAAAPNRRQMGSSIWNIPECVCHVEGKWITSSWACCSLVAVNSLISSLSCVKPWVGTSVAPAAWCRQTQGNLSWCLTSFCSISSCFSFMCSLQSHVLLSCLRWHLSSNLMQHSIDKPAVFAFVLNHFPTLWPTVPGR